MSNYAELRTKLDKLRATKKSLEAEIRELEDLIRPHNTRAVVATKLQRAGISAEELELLKNDKVTTPAN